MAWLYEKYMVHRATTSLTKYLPGTDQTAPYWLRVDNSLKRLAKRASKTGTVKEMEKTLEDRRGGGGGVGECISVPRLDRDDSEEHPLFDCIHLHSVRVFRFHWLDEASDLKAVEGCSNGFNEESVERFCINPYHYETRRWETKTKRIKTNLFVWPEKGLEEDLNYHLNVIHNPNYDLDTTNRLVLKWDVNGEPIKETFPSVDLKCTRPHQGTDSNGDSTVEVKYEEKDVWAAVLFFEGGFPKGASHQVSSSQFTVDASTEKRSTTERWIEDVRSRVGKGAQMHTVDGEMYLENLSESPLFLMSQFANFVFGYSNLAVIKISSKASLKVWSNKEFLALLEIKSEEGFREVEDLRTWGNIRVSFAKGWGADYADRRFKDMGCCFIATLPHVSIWVGLTMTAMGRPLAFASSNS